MATAQEDRIRWFEIDRSELEQITFGDEIQTYIAPYTVERRPVVSVVFYMPVPHLSQPYADLLAEAICSVWQPGLTLAAYIPQLREIRVHQYADSREIILDHVSRVEERFISLKKGVEALLSGGRA